MGGQERGHAEWRRRPVILPSFEVPRPDCSFCVRPSRVGCSCFERHVLIHLAPS